MEAVGAEAAAAGAARFPMTQVDEGEVGLGATAQNNAVTRKSVSRGVVAGNKKAGIGGRRGEKPGTEHGRGR